MAVSLKEKCRVKLLVREGCCVTTGGFLKTTACIFELMPVVSRRRDVAEVCVKNTDQLKLIMDVSFRPIGERSGQA